MEHGSCQQFCWGDAWLDVTHGPGLWPVHTAPGHCAFKPDPASASPATSSAARRRDHPANPAARSASFPTATPSHTGPPSVLSPFVSPSGSKPHPSSTPETIPNPFGLTWQRCPGRRARCLPAPRRSSPRQRPWGYWDPGLLPKETTQARSPWSADPGGAELQSSRQEAQSDTADPKP